MTATARLRTDWRERLVSALLSAAILLGMGVMLVLGLRPDLRRALHPGDLVAVAFSEPTPTPKPSRKPPPPPPARTSAPRGEAAPAALRARATAVVAPPAPVVLAPPPVVAAPLANNGSAASNGAADLPGTGQGSGGFGNGLGGGGLGGNGLGRAPGPESRPRQIRGRLSQRDLPDGLLAPGAEASVGVRYTVLTDGTVGDCVVTRSSGIAALDPVPCRLIRERFRFRPARDGWGRPVNAQIVETHTWVEEPSDEQRARLRAGE
ncbi:energy transducer TonB [Novosphingobium bradum]|uniref:Energy transducer TonB n=1 Tax=Novosphingobium bradum TaxID=1737444 RepID=A0ABV7IJQ8_9SPHN